MNDDSFESLVDNEREWRGHVLRLLMAQNGRVRKLEVWRGYITGALAAIIVFELWKLL